jgi:hypothetical protein
MEIVLFPQCIAPDEEQRAAILARASRRRKAALKSAARAGKEPFRASGVDTPLITRGLPQ